MLKKSFCFILIFFCTGLIFGGTIKNYTADQVETQSNVLISKVYAVDNKFRMETFDERGALEYFFIIREDQNKMYVFQVGSRTYTEQPIEQNNLTYYDQIMSIQQSFQQHIPGSTMEIKQQKLGTTETVLGYKTEKYSVTVTYEMFGQKLPGFIYYWWVAPEFDMPVRIQAQAQIFEAFEMTFELRNIKTASSPASLFEIPAGYAKTENMEY